MCACVNVELSHVTGACRRSSLHCIQLTSDFNVIVNLSFALFPALLFYRCSAGWRHQGAPQRHGGRPEDEKVEDEDSFRTVSLEQGAKLAGFFF